LKFSLVSKIKRSTVYLSFLKTSTTGNPVKTLKTRFGYHFECSSPEVARELEMTGN